MRVGADPLEVYDNARRVRAPDGRCYLVRVLPAGFGSSPLVPGGFQIGALAFAIGWVSGRAWRVEVRADEGSSDRDGWLSAPLVAITARTWGKRAAANEARKTAERIGRDGWDWHPVAR